MGKRTNMDTQPCTHPPAELVIETRNCPALYRWDWIGARCPSCGKTAWFEIDTRPDDPSESAAPWEQRRVAA
jgi:hypothetical protein